MAGKDVVLSRRLKALTEMVSPGKSVVDVGCDHGFVSIYLVQNGISPKVFAMDVRKGPLSRAQEHIAECGLEEYIQTRLSDGLCEYRAGEAQSLVCAGMGGRLMMKILTDSREKAQMLDELILQPQSEIPTFRRFLKEEGYLTLDENILCEEGKYYFLFKVAFCKDETLQEECSGEEAQLHEKYGKLLLQRRHPVLRKYLEFMQETQKQIARNLQEGQGEKAMGRLEEVKQEMESLEKAIGMFG